jgi:MOSC domain-containing protein YiiM
MRFCGHGNCGDYAEVVSAGEIAEGDALIQPCISTMD